MGLTDLQKAQFPPKLVLQPLPQTKYQLDEHPYSGGPAPGKTASEATDIGMAATDISTTSTSHGEPTNRAFAKSWKHKTWARRFKDREQFPNQFEALVASEVSEGSDGGFGVGVREGEMGEWYFRWLLWWRFMLWFGVWVFWLLSWWSEGMVFDFAAIFCSPKRHLGCFPQCNF